jgi:hypothetical protein
VPPVHPSSSSSTDVRSRRKSPARTSAGPWTFCPTLSGPVKKSASWRSMTIAATKTYVWCPPPASAGPWLQGSWMRWFGSIGNPPASFPIDEDQKTIREIVFLKRGTEFTSKAILKWENENKVEWHDIDPQDQFPARLIRGKSTYPCCSVFPSLLATGYLLGCERWRVPHDGATISPSPRLRSLPPRSPVSGRPDRPKSPGPPPAGPMPSSVHRQPQSCHSPA